MIEKNIKRYSLSRQVADQLEQQIENDVYKIDHKIPTEVELMEIFKVSRNTIREAIQSLVSAGILEVLQGDGTYVRANNRLDATMGMMLKGVKYDEINETRKTLEVSICYYASLRRTNKDLDAIYKALLERQKLTEDEKENTILDIKFHMEIAKASHNQVLVDLYKSLYSFLILNIQKHKNKTNLSQEEIDEYHVSLYQAIKNQEPEKARDFSRKILSI